MRVGDISYMDTMLEYYGVALAKRTDEMSDYEWAMKLAILEDIRQREIKE